MRTVLLCNNTLGATVGNYLADRGDLAGIVFHPPDRRRAHDDIEELSRRVDYQWIWPDGFEGVRGLGPECLLSVMFGYIVPAEWLAVPTWRALNLHPAYLPFNRGSAPNVWPIVDGSPAGSTLHIMEPGLDTGAFVAQVQVPVTYSDTGATLYDRLRIASFQMFASVWPTVRDVELRPQGEGGSYHRMADLADLDPTADDFALIDRLRSRTFPPYGAEFNRGGHRFRVRTEVEEIPDS